MIKDSIGQKGSIHVILAVVVVVALVGGLGFVFWQNFHKTDTTKQDTVASTAKAEQTQPASTPAEKTEAPQTVYKTYQTDTHPVSFQYPSTWQVKNTYSDDRYSFLRVVEVTTDEGDKVTLSTGGQGVGGACPSEARIPYSTLEVDPTPIEAPKQVTLSYTVLATENGGYDGYLGLTDYYTKITDSKACPNAFYYMFQTDSNLYLLISFNTKKHFASMDEARSFMSTDEYAAIKKMILTLNYQ